MSRTAMFVVCVIILIKILFLDRSKGCHLSPTHCHEQEEDGVIVEFDVEIECDTGHRRKREALYKTEDFMADCMDDKMPGQEGNMPTIVDYMMRHTIWYEKTNSFYCASDTVECWKHYLSYVIEWDSPYMSPCKNCIEDYGRKDGREIVKTTNVGPKLYRERNMTTPVDMDEFIELLNPLLPTMSQYDQSMYDLKYLVRFFTNDFICTANFCNCTGLTMIADEKCGDTWISRIVGATKSTSKLRIPMLTAANEAVANAKKRLEEEKRKRYYLIQKLLLLRYYLLQSKSTNNNTVVIKSSNGDK